ncbi:acyl-CoA dehydrogenase family protein [Streptomyces sp. BBFR51]|uniref:acyl-CoA dehydrogenase family protein n=1 Tax=Streptomyces sp. BBFR51 TaxID=3372856 RepID=UPI0037DCCDEA
MEALTLAGLPSHFVPSARGGDEGGFAALLADAAHIAEHCASAAWCGALWAAHGRFAAHLPEAGQKEVWETSPATRIAAAIMPPAGEARRVDGGRYVRGTWQFASGIQNSQWILVAAPDIEADHRTARVFALPRQVLAVKETWESTGLRATGTHSVSVDDVFVPDRRSFLLADLLVGCPAPGRARCHAVPAQWAGGLLLAATALGSARRALREWTGWALQPAAATGLPRTETAAVRTTLGTVPAHIDAADLLLRHAALRADTSDVTDEITALNQRDAAVAVTMLSDAVERLVRTGSHVVRTDGELQRAWRDIHTVAAHGALQTDLAAAALVKALTTPATLP